MFVVAHRTLDVLPRIHTKTSDSHIFSSRRSEDNMSQRKMRIENNYNAKSNQNRARKESSPVNVTVNVKKRSNRRTADDPLKWINENMTCQRLNHKHEMTRSALRCLIALFWFENNSSSKHVYSVNIHLRNVKLTRKLENSNINKHWLKIYFQWSWC